VNRWRLLLLASVGDRSSEARGAAAISTLGAPSVQAQKGQQILRFVAQADLKSLDPIWTTAYITRNHGYLVYDTLFGTDENSEIRPQMVDRGACTFASLVQTPYLDRFSITLHRNGT